MTSQSFEQVLNAVPAEGSLTPAWKKFVKTKFFVQVQRAPDNNPRNFSLHVAADPAGGEPAVLISEERERLNRQHGNATAALYGADIVKLLTDDAAILVALSDRAFQIATERVAWLKAGLQAAQARAAERSAGSAQTATPAVPFEPLLQRAGAVPPDMAALAPRSVGLPRAGLSFEVPGIWRESPSPNGLMFFDAGSGAKVDASATLRSDLSLEQWLQLRSAQFAQDMPFMRKRGPAYQLQGEQLGCLVTEYSGSFPGSGIDSCCLLACFQIDGSVAAMVITAPTPVFERDAQLYAWLLGQVRLGPGAEPAAPAARAPAAIAVDHAHDFASAVDSEAPPIFGFTMHGRLGRLRAMAYCFGVMLPLMALAMASALLGKAGMILIGVAVAIAVFFSLRVLVLRMHDINWSGKWLLAPIVLAGAAGALQKPQMAAFVGAALWLLMAVSLYLVPGSESDNDYGAAPPPNTTAVKVGAVLCIAVQLLALFGQSRLSGTRAEAAGELHTFTGPDKLFTLKMPGKPREVPTPAHVKARMGDVTARQFHLVHDKRTYVVQVIDYKINVDAGDMLDLAESKIVGPEGSATVSKSIQVNGLNGREVRATSLDGGMRGGRLFWIDRSLVMVLMAAPLAAGNEQAMEAYFGSLVFAPRP
ncbi:MAG: DUF805 domain-containing protein [Pseudomonadota bacterium]